MGRGKKKQEGEEEEKEEGEEEGKRRKAKEPEKQNQILIHDCSRPLEELLVGSTAERSHSSCLPASP